MDSKQAKKVAAAKWDRASSSRSQRPSHIRWWDSDHILRHINKRMCGKDVTGHAEGDVEMLKIRFPGRIFARAISVGCGNGTKEMVLLRKGIVGHFYLYEISKVRVEQGKNLAEKHGISDKITFSMKDPFNSFMEEQYDLVYWNNALHHMLNVNNAVRWSRAVLKPGGVFYMNDFVGPTRMQWGDRMLEMASRVRQALPEKYLRNPRDPTVLLPTRIVRPDVGELMRHDPTECADSENIIPAIKRHFRNPEFLLTGGTVYHLALSDVLHNLDDERDRHLLDLLLLVDDLCTMLGENHYGVAIAEKAEFHRRPSYIFWDSIYYLEKALRHSYSKFPAKLRKFLRPTIVRLLRK